MNNKPFTEKGTGLLDAGNTDESLQISRFRNSVPFASWVTNKARCFSAVEMWRWLRDTSDRMMQWSNM